MVNKRRHSEFGFKKTVCSYFSCRRPQKPEKICRGVVVDGSSVDPLGSSFLRLPTSLFARNDVVEIIFDWMEIFKCKCGLFLHQPCTLSCGHTSCRKCFESAEVCTTCGGPTLPKFRLNITLAGLLEQWFPKQWMLSDLKWRARKCIDEDNHNKAVELATECLKKDKEDSTALYIRAEANLKLSNNKQAYKDVSKSLKISPNIGEALFVLGSVCASLNKLDNAVEAYQQCLECSPDDSNLYGKVCSNLDELLSMPLGDEVDVSEEEEDIGETFEIDDKKDNALTNGSNSNEIHHGNVTNNNKSFSNVEDIPNKCDSEIKLDSQASNASNIDNVEKKQENNSGNVSKRNCDLSSVEDVPDQNDKNFLNETTAANDHLACTPSQLTFTRKRNYNMVQSPTECSTSENAMVPYSLPCSSNTFDLAPESTNKTDCFKSPCKKNCFNSADQKANICEKASKKVSTTAPTLDDFECKLCFDIYYQPTTTPCGHIFCKLCLARCIDRNPSCPVCRQKLEYSETGTGKVTVVIEDAAQHYFPEEFCARAEKREQYMKAKSRVGIDECEKVPIFPCVLVFPTIQSQFHIFEPRYRLMLRECLESGSRRFGISLSNKEGGHFNYGTIAEVKYAKFLPDGRSIIDIVGERRFKILESEMDNGISNGKVEYFEDNLELFQTDNQKEQLANKSMAVYNLLSDYIGKLHPSERECIFGALGSIPPVELNPWQLRNGQSWIWWATAALPLNDKVKVMIFKSQSSLERVTILNRLLTFLSKARPETRS